MRGERVGGGGLEGERKGRLIHIIPGQIRRPRNVTEANGAPLGLLHGRLHLRLVQVLHRLLVVGGGDYVGTNELRWRHCFSRLLFPNQLRSRFRPTDPKPPTANRQPPTALTDACVRMQKLTWTCSLWGSILVASLPRA